MAIRHCGSVKIDCKLVPARYGAHGKKYACVLSVGGKQAAKQDVAIPHFDDTPIDSPKAYDAAAYTAIWQATNPEIANSVSQFVETGDGYRQYIIRRSAKRTRLRR
jgi:hypothetical protein